MFTYIKKNVSGFYLELPEKLTSDLYSDLGETYEDFAQGKWVLLSNKQVAFHNEHPEASVKEVFDMALKPTPVRTLEDAKRELYEKINAYDRSQNVNGFTINKVVEAWFEPNERQGYKQSVDSAKLLGVESLSFFINDSIFSVATAQAELMLAALQLYADTCFIVTKQHRLAAAGLDTIESVDNYDYTTGYPAKLNFDIA